MLFAIITTDHENAFDKRLATRPEHVAWLKGLGRTVKLAGPFLVPAEDISNGSLIIIEAGSQEDADALAAQDPYARAGLFAQVEVRPWAWTINAPQDL